jgi:hypothetical protein
MNHFSIFIINVVMMVLIIGIVILLYCYYIRSESFTGTFKKDSKTVRQFLCEWDLIRQSPKGFLTNDEILYCRYKAKMMSSMEIQRLLNEYNIYMKNIMPY